MPEERELVMRARAGDGLAFAQLYEAYLGRVYRYVAYRVGCKEDAEDLTGQVFLRALESIGSYQWRGLPFSAWLFRIAHNLVVDHYRRRGRGGAVSLEEVPEPVGPGGDPLVGLEMADVREALSHLTEAQRQALLLRLVAGLSVAETARAMGKSPGAIKALQHAGLAALRRRLAGE